MCTIDKMLIKGIRSFSPHNQAVVEFYKPLTLIVGHNGAGKTTIIECLKQACTGDLPPNIKSGQGFIHDPKVAGETEVKAQIKLRIRTAAGVPVVIIRSFLLVQKKTALQFKAMDQTLQTHDKDGNKQALSYRCADIDRIIPNLMGVSKAILENVIFVHQEESNWPLSDGATLKRHFDDIFAATKYTKALEALRKLRTEKVQEAKEMKLKLEHARTHKDNADQLRGQVQEGQAKEASLQKEIASMDQQMEELQEAIQGMVAQQRKHQALEDRLEKLHTQQEVLGSQNADALQRIVQKYGEDELNTSLEELQGWLAGMSTDAAQEQAELGSYRHRVGQIEQTIGGVKEQCDRDLQAEASLQAAADAHQRALAERDQTVRRLAAENSLAGFAGTGALSEAALSRFERAFGELVSSREAHAAKVRQDNAALDDESAKAVDLVSGELSGIAQAVRVKRELFGSNEQRLVSLQAEVAGCAVSSDMVGDAEARERAARQALATKEERLRKLRPEAELQRLAAQLRDFQSRTYDLRQERDRLTSAAEGSTRLRIARQEALKLHEQVALRQNGSKARLQALLNLPGGDLPPAEQLCQEVERVIKDRQAEAEDASLAAAGAEREMAGVKGRLGAAEDLVRSKGRERDTAARKLETGLLAAYNERMAPEVLPDVQQSCQHLKEEHIRKMGNLKAHLHQINQWKQHAEENNECHTCQRPFRSTAELQQFQADQDEAKAKGPSTVLAFEKNLADATKRLEQLNLLQPSWLRFDAIRTKELPAAEAKVGELAREAQRLAEQVDQLQDAAADKERASKEAQKCLAEVAQPLAQLAGQLADRQRQIAALRAEMGAEQGARGVADVDNDLDELDSARTRAEQDRDDLQRKQSRAKDEVAAATSEWHRAKEELSNLARQSERRSALESQAGELSKQNGDLDAEIGDLQGSVARLEDRRRRLSREREGRRADMRKQEEAAEASVREVARMASQLEAQARPIQQYEAAGSSARLAEVSQRLGRTRESLARQQGELQAALEALRAVEQRATSHEETQYQLQTLISYKKSKGTEDGLTAQIEQVLAEQSAAGNTGQLAQKYKTAQRQCQDLSGSQNMKRGSLGTVQEQVQRAQRSLGAAHFTDIDAKFRTQQIELHTTELATSDLDKYHKALEKALLHFHSTKMADINKIIKELWQKTYRGQDIDCIQIKADTDGSRSYNYRVTMISGGAELDMRGRCSAGQKVLACLIIRLALAETFCLNCGILALDEPTTNLDAANASSLAEALRDVMEARKAQSNFQLVVITHDERFASMIGTREHAEFMWRMTKDDNQHSKITQEPVMG